MTIIAKINRKELQESLIEVLPDAIFQAKHVTNPEVLYTVSQVARMFEKKYDTVKRMIEQKRLRATSDNKYISRKAIDEYLMKRKHDSIVLERGRVAIITHNQEDFELIEQAISDAGAYTALNCFDEAWNRSDIIRN